MGLRWVLAALLLVLAPAAHAGDVARLAFLGWSPDGRYVAIGNAGVQDGSGFAYADRTIVDARTGRTVFYVYRVEDETVADPGQVAAVEVAVARAAEVAMAQHGLARPAAGTVAVRGQGVLPAHSADWGRPIPSQSVSFVLRGARYTVRVTQQVRGDIAHDPYAVRGAVAVRLFGPEGGRVLYEDAAWTTRYLHRIHTISIGPGGRTMAVVLAAWAVGFEGPDVRYLVVAGTL